MTKSINQRLSLEFVDDVTIVEFLDRVISQVYCESDDVQLVGRQIDQIVESLRPRWLLLDFSQVELMASSMLGYFLQLKKKIEHGGGRLIFCSLKENVDQVFEITNLRHRFEIYPDQNSALDAFSGR